MSAADAARLFGVRHALTTGEDLVLRARKPLTGIGPIEVHESTDLPSPWAQVDPFDPIPESDAWARLRAIDALFYAYNDRPDFAAIHAAHRAELEADLRRMPYVRR